MWTHFLPSRLMPVPMHSVHELCMQSSGREMNCSRTCRRCSSCRSRRSRRPSSGRLGVEGVRAQRSDGLLRWVRVGVMPVMVLHILTEVVGWRPSSRSVVCRSRQICCVVLAGIW